jgi:DNA-binding MarR family transcriptional regulator
LASAVGGSASAHQSVVTTVRLLDYSWRVDDDVASTDPVGSWHLPALLRGARTTFGTAIRRELTSAGYDDVPPNGLFVLGAMTGTSAPLADIIQALGVSKQTAGALVDSLVVRGYLDRRADPTDRRRMVVSLTDRGADASALIRRSVADVESALEAAVGPEAMAHARRVLVCLVEGRQEGD